MNVNRPSWPTFPYKLSSFVPVRLPIIGWGSSTPTYHVTKIQYKSNVQTYNKKTNESLKNFIELSNR